MIQCPNTENVGLGTPGEGRGCMECWSRKAASYLDLDMLGSGVIVEGETLCTYLGRYGDKSTY